MGVSLRGVNAREASLLAHLTLRLCANGGKSSARSKLKSAYNIRMAAYVIKNRVPSAEEMGRRLGLSDEQVAAVREIMSSPSTVGTSKRSSGRAIAGANLNKRTAKRSTSRASGRR